jgi:1,6-anhydro-N-acetylmuramate kinase
VRHFSGFARGDFEFIVGGGGTGNATLMRFLREEMAPAPVLTLEEVGFGSDAKKRSPLRFWRMKAGRACRRTSRAQPGARGARVLGKIVPV